MPGIEACLADAMTLPGARGAAIVDWSSGLALGTAGAAPGGGHEVTAVEAAELARLAIEQTAFRPPLDGGAEVRDTSPFVEDVIVTTRTEFHVLRFIETSFDSSVFLHLWLDRHEGNLALARLRLRSLATELVLV